MPRYYTNGLEMPEPKAHKDLSVQEAQAAFSLIQDRGRRNYARIEKAEQKEAEKPEQLLEQWSTDL